MRCPAFVCATCVVTLAHAQTEPSWAWETQTQSPIAVSAAELTDQELELQRACGTSEAGLRRVAKKLVERKALELPYLDTEALSFALRASGEPHVWPHAWIVSARALDQDSLVTKLTVWRRSFQDSGLRRCGVATGYSQDGTRVVAAVALDALADLTVALPTTTHVGTWLTIDARVNVPATGARVVVVGPGGEPHNVPSSFDGARIVARFAPDRVGAFTVQVVIDAATGPRPSLMAQVFADEPPPTSIPNLSAPFEAA